jgi:hypothetical protein
MTTRYLLLFVVALASPTLSRAADPAATSTEFFPIMAWDGVPDDPAVFKKMRDCGFTVAGFVPVAGLDNCHAAGMKAIVSDERCSGYDWQNVDATVARKNLTALIGEVRNHPAVYGYYLRDEPSSSFFPGLATVSGIVKELHPGAWPYINLFPNYANAGQLGAANYDEYVEKFVETCQPPIISYDHYAILQGGSLRGEYFANLKSVRRAARKHKLPFWQIVLACGCLDFREPSETDLRFQVYTSLAYGARGLAWFKYFTPGVGNFRNGPIDQFGNETETWHAMRRVNLQVAKLAPTLLKLKSDRVYHFGSIPTGATGPDDKCLVKAVGGPMLAGDFTHEDGTRYVMIVNKDFANAFVCAPQFSVPVKKLEFISAWSGTPITFEGEYMWLAPGQGVLLKLTQ